MLVVSPHDHMTNREPLPSIAAALGKINIQSTVSTGCASPSRRCNVGKL